MHPKDIIPEATKYQIDPAALWAVVLTESSGGGFLNDRFPRYSTLLPFIPKDPEANSIKILFERHILWKRLLSRGISPAPLARDHPNLCGPRWERKYYEGGMKEYGRINQVYDWAYNNQHDKIESYRKALLESCSWGLFQLMGFNYAAAGFSSVDQMVTEFQRGETVQVEGILKWIKAVGLLDNLQRKDWIGFTRGYNGPGQIPIYAPRLYSNYLKSRKYYK